MHRYGFATRAIHHGYDPAEHQGALVPPIYQTATFTFANVAEGAARFAGEAKGNIYTRLGNPTLALLEERLASLEQGQAAVCFGSGMGAISSTLWTLLRPGDEIIADITLYGCTMAFLDHGLAEFGVRVRHLDLSDADALDGQLNERTRVVYLETPANPTMHLCDIATIAAKLRGSQVRLVIDNTYCTPYLQTPLALGADVVLHSATKYLSGHGDVMAGAAVCRDPEVAGAIRMRGLKDFTGAVLSPHDASLVLRGLKTLGLRMDRHCANAQAMAQWLDQHPAVQRVAYPGLPGFAQHRLAERQMRGPGGMIAFELAGGLPAGIAFLDALQLIQRAVSLGDAETLAQHPASMTHATCSAEERAAAGIGDGLVRLSAGLEDPADLLADLAQAMQRLPADYNVTAAAPELRSVCQSPMALPTA